MLSVLETDRVGIENVDGAAMETPLRREQEATLTQGKAAGPGRTPGKRPGRRSACAEALGQNRGLPIYQTCLEGALNAFQGSQALR